MNPVLIGIRGSVLALDRRTGAVLWTTQLCGSDFVTLVLDGGRILAATRGEVFALDAATGKQLWRNELKGMGRGLISIATSTAQSSPVSEEKHRRDEAAQQNSGTT